MTKPTVVLSLLVSIALFSLFSQLPPQQSTSSNKKHGIRKLHRRGATFDPLVNKLGMKAEEEGSIDINAFRERIEDELHFGEGGTLNTTKRLTFLFPLLDRDPMDGVVSYKELEIWNRMQAVDRMVYNMERSLKVHDKDEDGSVTLEEFLGNVNGQNEDELGNKANRDFQWWKVQFVNADMDGNGSLNETEFNDLLHPEDSTNPKVQMWLLHEKMREMDQDGDGKLCFQEFYDETHELFSNHFLLVNENDATTLESKAENMFAELDVNKDKFLTAEELKPIISYLCPGELSYAKYYTKHLMEEADDDKDGKLTLEEMINHQIVFYNAVFEEPPASNNDQNEDDESYDHYEL